MKKLMTMLFVCLLASGLLVSKAQTQQTHGKNTEGADTTQTDSTLDVIGYFANGDTCDYWITESKWKINDKDTTQVFEVATKIRIVVTDSTANGYKMYYTFMDFKNDTIAKSKESKLMNIFTDRVAKSVIGTKIEFDTDEFGAITKIHNLGDIKKQAKTLLKDCMKDLAAQPEMKALKEMGLDIADIVKKVDMNEVAEGYVEELKDLFICHGNSYQLGTTHKHEDATKDSYESDTYLSASIDDDDNYTIASEVIQVIPQDVIKSFVGGLVGMMKNKDVSDSFDKEFDKQVNTDGSNTSYFEINCFPDGWPYELVKQNKTKVGNVEKVTQTNINACYFSHEKK